MDISGGGVYKIPLANSLFGTEMSDVRRVVTTALMNEPAAGVKSGSIDSSYFVGLGSFAWTSEHPSVDNTMNIITLQFKGDNAKQVFNKIREYTKGNIEFDQIGNK